MSVVTITPTGKPAWSRDAAIGDYGGALDKRESATEGKMPYAYAVYRELVAMRGSAYTSLPGTLVYCQNLAKARLLAYVWFRLPEKLRANSLPAHADDGLDYWVEALAVPVKPSDKKWQKRQRCAAHYKALTDTTLPAIQTALSDLLGDVYVDATFSTGGDMSTPPDYTYWPGVNTGPTSYDLGGGTWVSVRCHLFVEVTRPAGMTLGEFNQLMGVQLPQLLDRLLPAYCRWGWATSDGFIIGESLLGYDGL